MPGDNAEIVRHQLRAKQVEKLAASGVYQDGGGLQLRVRDTGAKFWVLRVTAKGKRSDKGLGSFPNVSLEEARAKADAVRRAIKSGVPIPATKTEVGITFKEAFDICWRSKRQVFPKIGHMSVADIGAGEIVDVWRSGEARFAVWTEIVGGQWIIPAERTKMRRQHIVPLNDAAKVVLELARNLPRPTGCQLMFPSPMTSNPLSDMAMTKSLRDLGFAEAATVHGFRSSFRTWCAEVARCRPEVAEAALAHAI